MQQTMYTLHTTSHESYCICNNRPIQDCFACEKGIVNGLEMELSRITITDCDNNNYNAFYCWDCRTIFFVDPCETKTQRCYYSELIMFIKKFTYNQKEVIGEPKYDSVEEFINDLRSNILDNINISCVCSTCDNEKKIVIKKPKISF